MQSDREDLPRALREPLDRNVQLLLHSRIPARLAWTDGVGSPRVAPLWFHWTGDTIDLSTFAGSKKLQHLHDHDPVAVTIDTEDFPYRSLNIRGTVTVEHMPGLTESYQAAARRYLGDEPARDWCERLRRADQALLRVHPRSATVSHMWDAKYVRERSSRR